MVHRPHGDVHEVGLQDDCERCAEIADAPFRFADERLLRQLTELAVSRDRFGEGRSGTELVASATILTTLERVGKLCEFSSDLVAVYLRERWRVDAAISNPRQAEMEAFRDRLEGRDDA